MVRVNHYLGRTQWLAVLALSRRSGLPVAEHIRRAVDAYLRCERESESIGSSGTTKE
jgi:hypothetical protein